MRLNVFLKHGILNEVTLREIILKYTAVPEKYQTANKRDIKHLPVNYRIREIVVKDYLTLVFASIHQGRRWTLPHSIEKNSYFAICKRMIKPGESTRGNKLNHSIGHNRYDVFWISPRLRKYHMVVFMRTFLFKMLNKILKFTNEYVYQEISPYRSDNF